MIPRHEKVMAAERLEAAVDRASRANAEYRKSMFEGYKREAAARDIVLMELSNLMEEAARTARILREDVGPHA